MKLMELQRTMARAVMQPLTPSENMQRKSPTGGAMHKYVARFIKPNNRLTSFERLEIYNRQYWWRVLSSMMEDFPGLQAVLGERRFEEMCKAYLCEHPSRSFTLRNLGSRLEEWLRKHPKWAGAKQNLALEIVRLEWADIEAFDAKQEPVIVAEDLNSQETAELRLPLQPHIRLLALSYPVDDLLLEVRDSDEEKDVASNAMQERKKRKRVQTVAKLKPAEIYLAVHRIDNSVYFRRLEREEFLILGAMQKGKTLGEAIEMGFRKSAVPAEKRAGSVQEWFQNWAALGWFAKTEETA